MGHRIVRVLLLAWLVTTTSQQIPEPPKWICIPDSEIEVIIDHYEHEETKNGIKEWKGNGDRLKIQYTESYENISDTWIILNEKK